MRRFLLCLAVVLVLAPGARAGAPPEERPLPRDLMGRLVEQPPDYAGRRLVVVWSASGTRAVEFAETRKGARLRLEMCPTVQSGPALLLGDQAGWLVYQHPQSGRPDSLLIPEAQSRTRLEQAFRSHAWRVEGASTVAGRPAWVLVAAATYPGGLRNVFWIDREYPVVLQREKYDSQSRLVYRSTFVALDFKGSIQERLFEVPAQHRAATVDEGPIPFSPAVPALPLPGFAIEHSDPLPPSLARMGGHHTVYSDGLESVSLFQFSASVPVRLRGARAARLAGNRVWTSQVGAANMLAWSDGQRSFLAVSALPLETLEPMVGRLAPARPPASPGLAGYLRRGWNRVLGLLSRG